MKCGMKSFIHSQTSTVAHYQACDYFSTPGLNLNGNCKGAPNLWNGRQRDLIRYTVPSLWAHFCSKKWRRWFTVSYLAFGQNITVRSPSVLWIFPNKTADRGTLDDEIANFSFHQESPLLTCINFNPNMDKSLHPLKTWDEIIYAFPNFHGCSVEVWEWISNFIPHFTRHAITCPCWNFS